MHFKIATTYSKSLHSVVSSLFVARQNLPLTISSAYLRNSLQAAAHLIVLHGCISWLLLAACDHRSLSLASTQFWLALPCLSWLSLREAEVEVTLWLKVSQSVYLGVEPTLRLVTRYYFLSESCGLVSVRRPLWREDRSAVCSAIAQWFESRRIRNHTLLSYLRLPKHGGSGSRIYIPQEYGDLVIPQALGSLYIASYDSQGYAGGFLTLPQPGGEVPVYITPRNRLV
jgi:hypothetical protein